MNFSNLDLTVFIGYLVLMVGFGVWIANRNKAKTSKDYFLASGALPWWAVGGSLIASNISAEQILGMNGSGYVMGLAIGAYELMAALTLILVAKFFLPVFLKKEIYTLPQFLEKRFDGRVRSLMAFFWVLLFVFVNITSVLYLGALAIQSVFGYEWVINDMAQATILLEGTSLAGLDGAGIIDLLNTNRAAFGENLTALIDNDALVKEYNVPLVFGIIGLVLYSATFSIFGGLKAVVWTDVIQVVVLVVGGLVASYLILNVVSGGDGFFAGLSTLYEKAPGHFNMILEKDHPSFDKLPGISVLIGGMWISNLYYWGTNQYIIQRALASKSIGEAQKGVVFAAFLKILIPLFAVIPGIAAYVILQDPDAFGFVGQGFEKNDEAFPWVLNNFVTVGFKGVVLAALVAAIGSSISSMANSASTIFTLDIYKELFVKSQSETHYVSIGKTSAAVSLLIGALIAPQLGSLDQVFQFIQNTTGYYSPGVLAVFIFGIFWKRATANGAFLSVLLVIPISIALAYIFPGLPFLSRMGLCFALICAVFIITSLLENKNVEGAKKRDSTLLLGIIGSLLLISVPAGVRIILGDIEVDWTFGAFILAMCSIIFVLLLTESKQDDHKAFNIDGSVFKTSTLFNVSTVLVTLILGVIYYFLW